MLRLLANPWTVAWLIVVAACVGGGAVAFGEQGADPERPKRHADTRDGERVLKAPRDAWESPSPSQADLGPAKLFGKAFHYDAFVYDKTGTKPAVAGVVRRGTTLPVRGAVSGSGCNGGTWYEAEPFGYVCTSLGFHVSESPSEETYGVPRAKVETRLPYQYARVVTKRAPRYYRIPTIEEERQARRAMERKGASPEVVSSLMDGDYFLAVADKREREADGATFYRTVRNRYVRESDLELRNPEIVRGEQLGRGGWQLPIAFVYEEDRPLLARQGERLVEVGIAEKHARFVATEELQYDGQSYVAGEAGIVQRDHVRVVRRIEAPSKIPDDSKWIHVDLSEQTLVAYEGRTAVYATVISSGKKGYEPPTGTFQVQQKYVSTTMNATDPIDGFYEVEEVPWTLYYHRGYAVHGAYWHTDFGKVRSHGCTNVAPVDARWLYYWSDPDVPPTWHAVRFQPESTWVYFTK